MKKKIKKIHVSNVFIIIHMKKAKRKVARRVTGSPHNERLSAVSAA